MKVYGQLEKAQAEQLAADPGTPVIGQIWFNTTSNQLKMYDGTSTVILGSAAGALAISSKTASYTLLSTDDVIIANAAVDITLTLPAAAGVNGKQFFIHKIDSNGTVVTIDGDAAETINGEATITINGNRSSLAIVSDGTSWYTLSDDRDQVVILKETQPSGTSGGGSVNNGLQTRALNTREGLGIWLTTSGVTFTVTSPGRYKVRVTTTAYQSNQTQVFLYNRTDLTYDIDGLSGYSDAAGATANSIIYAEGIVEITASKEYEIRHFTATAQATTGLGVAANATGNPQASEVYTTVEITKLK